MLGGITPKALVRQYGVEMTADGRKVSEVPVPQKPSRKDPDYQVKLAEYEAQVREYQDLIRNGYSLIDLRGKILLFLEAPHQEAFMVLRPILSHDEHEISYPLVEKTEKGQVRTRKVVVRGWPSTIFCTTDIKYIEELATRSITTSPQTTEEKVKEVLALIDQQDANPWNFQETEDTLFIRRVISHVKHIAQEYKVIIPFSNLHEVFPKHLVRFMRDYRHLKGIIKAFAYLRFPNRRIVEKDGQKYILASADDVIDALKLFQAIYETTETGIDERILSFYHNIVEKREEWTLKELTQEYNKQARRKVSSKAIRNWLASLEDIGLVDSEPHPDDKRVLIFRPVKGQEIWKIMEVPHLLVDLLEKSYGEWLENNPEIRSHIVRSELPVLPHMSSNIERGKISEILPGPSEKSSQEEKAGIMEVPHSSIIPVPSQGDKPGNQESAILNYYSHQESCETCSKYDLCDDRKGPCKYYSYKYAVRDKKEAVNKLMEKMTEEKNKVRLVFAPGIKGWTTEQLLNRLAEKIDKAEEEEILKELKDRWIDDRIIRQYLDKRTKK